MTRRPTSTEAPDALTQARSAVERTKREVAKREAELLVTRSDEKVAIQKYDESGKDEDVDAASKARLRRERHERLLANAQEAHETATKALQAVEKDLLREKLRAECEQISKWRETISAELSAFLEIDRRLDQVVLSIAGKISEADELRAVAVGHARELGESTLDIATPSLADARLSLARELLRTRTREAREDLSDWLISGPADWRLEDVNAADLAAIQDGQARARAEEQAAAVLANLPVRPTTTTTTTTKEGGAQ